MQSFSVRVPGTEQRSRGSSPVAWLLGPHACCCHRWAFGPALTLPHSEGRLRRGVSGHTGPSSSGCPSGALFRPTSRADSAWGSGCPGEGLPHIEAGPDAGVTQPQATGYSNLLHRPEGQQRSAPLLCTLTQHPEAVFSRKQSTKSISIPVVSWCFCRC